MEADDGETTPAVHAGEAPDKLQPTGAKIFHIAAAACIMWQNDVNSTAYHPAVNHTAQKPSNLQRSK